MQTIDITTTQNVTIEYELATLYFILFITIISIWPDLFTGSSMLLTFFSQLFPIACFISYQLFSEILTNGQSWGKKVMGLKVVRLDGKEPGLSDYLLRAVFHIVDSLFTFGVLGALLISSSNKSQRLGDMTANTTVIRVKFNLRFQLADILKINSLEDYEPTYPEVRKLSEKDMLLIKNIIAREKKYRNVAHTQVINELVTKLMDILDLVERPKNKIEFLKTLIRDYIVLTR